MSAQSEIVSTPESMTVDTVREREGAGFDVEIIGDAPSSKRPREENIGKGHDPFEMMKPNYQVQNHRSPPFFIGRIGNSWPIIE